MTNQVLNIVKVPGRRWPLAVSPIMIALFLFCPVTAKASPGQCTVASALVAESGPVTGNWADTGVVNNIEFDCSSGSCTYTGEINTWNCSNPSFTYAGPDTGYEYTYSFTSPGDGTCTFIEYEEDLGVVDWFLVASPQGAACDTSNCIGYIWENVNDPICGGNAQATCSLFTFAVQKDQAFFIVADIYAGMEPDKPVVYPFEDSWTVEVSCDIASEGIYADGFE